MRRSVGIFLLLIVLITARGAFARDLTRYAVVMTGPAAVEIAKGGDHASMEAARATVHASHAALRLQLRNLGVPVTGEADTLLNAVFVAPGPTQLDAVRAMPGVSYVAKLPVFHRNLDAAVKLINAPAAWSLLGGTSNAGAGVKIAIIDTGIESTHPAFQDPTLTPPAGFPICDVPSDCAFTNNKIIAARSYISIVAAGTGSDPAADSRPDDISARDRVGHGTAVAMAAAGVTNTGPSDTITGVAPKAFLGSYKIFGSPGVNDSTTGDAIIIAVEAAYNDGMDIAVMSLGATAVYGPTDTGSTCGLARGEACDVIASVVQTAATTPRGTGAAMVVVAAAGNDGSSGSLEPSLGTITTPGDAPAAIGVAATTNSHMWSNAVTVGGVSYQSDLGDGPAPAAIFTGPLSDVGNVGDPEACSAPPANSLAGTIALAARGTCTFEQKVQNLEVAGATGAIVMNNPGDDTLVLMGGLSGTTTIPATFVGYDDGQSIRVYLAGNPGATVSINPNLAAFNVSTYNEVASFSSRGPVLGSAALKPDVAAVGTDLYLTAQNYDPNGELYSANGYIVSQGTSFSTPQIAGVAALVKQTNPLFSVAEIKSAIVNTATQEVTDGGATASVLAVGAGEANAASAMTTNLVASPVSVSFGVIAAGVLPVSQAIQLINTGTTALNVTIALNRRTPENNAHTSIDLPNLSIAAGATGTFHVTLSGTVPSPGIYEGLVTVSGGADTLQIPYLYIVGSGVPADIISILGNGDTGIAGQQNSEGGIFFQVLDQFGIPVPNLPVSFSVSSGGGSLSDSDSATDAYGFAGSYATLGALPGTNIFTATAGELSTTFTIASSYQPTINPNGALNGADFSAGRPVAAGSLISLFGSNLAPLMQTFSTPYFPVSIDDVSVSFDTPTISVPGRLVAVSPGQVNVQVPWELEGALAAGQTSAQVKVSIGDISGALYNLPLGSYSPALFQYPAGYAAALDENNRIVSTSNPVAEGSVVQLYVNGLGPVSNQPASGDPASLTVESMTNTTPVVMIGGQSAQVIYSGLASGYAGLYQVNAMVPATGPGLQTISISIGGVTSAATKIAVE